MMLKSALILLVLGLEACAQGRSQNSPVNPPELTDPGTTSGTSSIKLTGSDSYLLTQNEDKTQVLVPVQMNGVVEITLNSCFESVGKGFFKDPQGQKFPFSQFMISLQAQSRGTAECINTFVVNLPVMQEIEGTINFEFKASNQTKTFTRSFAVVAKDKIQFDGDSPENPGKPGRNPAHEDGKCGGNCEELISKFMDHVLGFNVRVYNDVFGNTVIGGILFSGTNKKGTFVSQTMSFPFDEGTFEVRDKRLVLTKKGSTETLEFAYLAIQDAGRSSTTPTLLATAKIGPNEHLYYIW